MKAPEKVIEGELATFWFDESGILCANGKSIARDLDMQKRNFALIREISAGKKICLLSDNTQSQAQDKATRDYTTKELPRLFKAMAIISNSALGLYSVKIFTNFNQQPIPIQFFDTEEEAKAWLRTYL
ncbi:MAG TPA: STAS/SEC14 domain-containing protein [Bacteroidia bacterium]|jgi:hypothetical protein|nr:STAS/SEC14 domain-containing protein [Bacteroidia bacterium]